ncbi:nitroreductase family protein [Priestia endophytica]|uniref:nitroreductase family protein n=1 Tax=Priestia endophytica TaxID=135735 RepID=UPI000DCA743B|nr:nitroreductase family protein [Priestia endophytica]RAS74564.1 nitroreductase [Priestia endophytica]
MTFLDLAKKRSAVRQFDRRKVEREKLLTILEAGRVAPTACNYQPQKILVLETSESLAKLRSGNKYIYESPLALIVCSNLSQSWKHYYDGRDSAQTDVGIVTTHMMLAATDLGLGSLWVHGFEPENVRRDFNIPAHLDIVNILLIGYPDGPTASADRHNSLRKPLQETVILESF